MKRGKIEGAAHRAANDQRQSVDQVLVDGDARFRVLGMELYRGGLHLDHLARLTDFQIEIGARVGGGVHGKAVDLRGTKAGLLDTDIVCSDRDFRSRKLASIATGDVGHLVGGGVGDYDLSLGNSRAARIADSTGNGATFRLSNKHGNPIREATRRSGARSNWGP